jgi:tetratricopeptide (TPR) repeat protein
MRRFLLILMLLLGAWGAQAQETPEEPQCPPVAEGAEPLGFYVGGGDVAFAQKDYTGAIFLYTCALATDADFAPAYVSRAYAYSELLDIERAQADFDEAVRLDEANVSIYVNRGAFYTTQGNFGLAINDLTLALTLDPQNLIAFNNRAVVHAIEGNYDLALEDIAAALAIDESYPATYATQAAIYSAMAAEAYQQFVVVSGTNNPRLPAGTPTDVLSRIDASFRTGDFGVWLALLVPTN